MRGDLDPGWRIDMNFSEGNPEPHCAESSRRKIIVKENHTLYQNTEDSASSRQSRRTRDDVRSLRPYLAILSLRLSLCFLRSHVYPVDLRLDSLLFGKMPSISLQEWRSPVWVWSDVVISPTVSAALLHVSTETSLATRCSVSQSSSSISFVSFSVETSTVTGISPRKPLRWTIVLATKLGVRTPCFLLSVIRAVSA